MHLDAQNRAKKVEVLPDFRLRVTTRLDAQYQLYKDAATFVAEVLLPWGTVCEEFPQCRLISQPSSGQIENAYKNPNDPPPVLLRVYEELPQDARVIVGLPGVSYNQYGFQEVVITYIQLSNGSTSYSDVVGTSTAPAPYSAAVLKTVDGSNDGTLRTYKLTYTTGGEMADTIALRFGGKVLERTLVYLNEVPPAPSGYSYIGTSITYIGGLPLYEAKYVAAAGGGTPGTAGEVSRSYYNAQGGPVDFDPDNPASPNGSTKVVIQYVTPLSTTSNPITLPADFVLVGLEVQEDTGYKMWTATGYYGAGLVVDESAVDASGAIVTYHRVQFGSAPSAPSATIGGTVTLVSSEERNADGYDIYEARWVEANGEVSRAFTNAQGGTTAFDPSNPDGGVGSVLCTITHVTSVATSSSPIVAPTSFVLIGEEVEVRGGYKQWTGRYGFGSGLVLDETTISETGGLVLYHRIAFGSAPSTPSATIGGTVTLYDSSTRNDDGFLVYDYKWAEGDGEVSRKYTNAQGGATDFNPASPGSATGNVVCTIVHFTAPATSSNPTSAPTASFHLIDIDTQLRNGYKVWTVRYGFGDGLILDEVTIQASGALVVYHRVAYGTAPSAPSATIGGTVTLVSEETRNADGYVIYDYRWAEGNGEISRDYVNAQGGAVSFDPATPTAFIGPVRCVIRYATALGVTTDPTSAPAVGFVRVAIEDTTGAGFKTWTVTWAYGNGLVLDESTISETGGLVLYHRIALGTAPSAPSATIGGTVTLFEDSERNADGYVVYERRWAEGDGEVSRRYTNAQGGPVAFNPSSPGSATGSVICTITHFTATSVTSNPTSAPTASFYLVDIQNELRGGYKVWTARYGFGSGLVLDEQVIQVAAALVVYHRVSFGSAPSTPSATIGGTVTLFESSVRDDSGFSVYDYRWAEGDGEASITTEGESDGALVYTVVTYTAAASTPSYPGSGTAYLIRLTQKPENGYFQNTAVYKKPPATVTFKKKINFTKPGSAVIGGSPIQLVFNSPVTMDILADVEVSYDTTQDTTTPFTVEAWATYYETYTPTDTGLAVSSTKALGGYLAGASGTSGTNSVFNGILCDSWEYQLGSSTPSSFSAATHVLDVDNDPYLTATDGTVVYRRTVVSYDFS